MKNNLNIIFKDELILIFNFDDAIQSLTLDYINPKIYDFEFCNLTSESLNLSILETIRVVSFFAFILLYCLLP